MTAGERRKPSVLARALKAIRRVLVGERAAPPSPQELVQRFGGWSRVPPQAWVRRRGARR